MKKEDLIACVLRAHELLGSEDDLSPRNPKINETLGALVNGIIEGCPPDDVKGVLDDPGVRAVRGNLLEKLAIAEGEMEKYWGEMFCARASLAAADFREFIYWDCYRYLVREELCNLPPGLKLGNGHRIAFVGAGPLPLSAVIMHVRTGMKVTCIDIDPQACRLARDLCCKAGLMDIEIKCADGAECDYANSPVVFIASLVPEKAKVVERIREECPHACVALRSVEGLCTLLYDPVDETELEAIGCGLLGRTCHNPQVINTTLFYQTAPLMKEDAAPSHSMAVHPAASWGSSLLGRA